MIESIFVWPTPAPQVHAVIDGSVSMSNAPDGWLIAGTIASILVALGTEVLALATFCAVRQAKNAADSTAALAEATKQSIDISDKALGEQRHNRRDEDRRHQQSFAPFLILKYVGVKEHKFAFDVENHGKGFAQRVKVTFTDHSTSSAPVFNREGSGAPQPLQDDTHNISVVASTMPAGLFIPQTQMQDRLTITNVSMTYDDMFDNTYTSIYKAFTDDVNDFQWGPPVTYRVTSI